MKRSILILFILVVGVNVMTSSQSIGIGGKLNGDLDYGIFSEIYFSSNLSMNLAFYGATTQTPSLGINSFELSAKFYAPSYVNPLSLYGGGGIRWEFDDGTQTPKTLLILGSKLNSGFGFNLFGELNLVSNMGNVKECSLEPWIGVEFRFPY